MPNRIWAFKWDYTTSTYIAGKGGLATRSDIESATPSLVPPTTDGYTKNQNVVKAITDYIQTVNVARDYPWTYSKPGEGARQEVPKIYMLEKRLKTNAFISSLVYSFANAQTGAQEIIDTLEKNNIGTGEGGFLSVLKDLQQSAVNGAYYAAGSISNFINNKQIKGPTDENTFSQIVETGKSTLNPIFNFFRDRAIDNNPIFEDPLLTAYKNLYPCINTGWNYVFPYFDDYFSSSQNIFGDDTGMNVLNLIKTGAEAFQSIAGLAGAITRPFGFSFQEKAKFYNFPSEGEEFKFEFPLINTGSTTFDEVVKNWQLIYLLLYQNKPARINRNVIEPPVLYEVSIPGQKFYPFCYISNIEVDFKGSRRELEFNLDYTNTVLNDTLPVPLTGPTQPGTPPESSIKDIKTITETKKFRTIIPDAYVIRITLKALTAETRNFMAYTVLGPSAGTAAGSVTDLDKLTEAVAKSLLGNSANGPSDGTPVNYGNNPVLGNGQTFYTGGTPFFDERTGLPTTPEISAPARR
jgi:hypothetical protein